MLYKLTGMGSQWLTLIGMELELLERLQHRVTKVGTGASALGGKARAV